jgi:hypothetical protein
VPLVGTQRATLITNIFRLVQDVSIYISMRVIYNSGFFEVKGTLRLASLNLFPLQNNRMFTDYWTAGDRDTSIVLEF